MLFEPNFDLCYLFVCYSIPNHFNIYIIININIYNHHSQQRGVDHKSMLNHIAFRFRLQMTFNHPAMAMPKLA